jgi:surfactin synthase thioesterase subunit
VFCFPYAGGGASAFRGWARELPADVEVLAIRAPGRESRIAETPFARLEPLVSALTEVLLPHLDIPFVFFGHSLGALVCFEVARELRRRSAPGAVRLIVSGRQAPHVPDPDPPVHHLPDREFLIAVREFNGTPDEVVQHAELLELLLPVLRADIAINETYEYRSEPPLDCPISAFGGLQDEKSPRESIAAWRKQTSSAFSLRMFPGDHFFIHTARRSVLEAISQDLLQS